MNEVNSCDLLLKVHFTSLLLSVTNHGPGWEQVSEFRWRQRVWVKGFREFEEGTYSFNLVQSFGGRYDGIWFTESLHADACNEPGSLT